MLKAICAVTGNVEITWVLIRQPWSTASIRLFLFYSIYFTLLYKSTVGEGINRTQ